MRPTLAFDFDGVIANPDYYLARRIAEAGFTLPKPRDRNFYFMEAYGLPLDFIRAVVADLVQLSDPRLLPPYPHAARVLRGLSQKAAVYIVTARPNQTPVKEWLTRSLGHDVCIGVWAVVNHLDKARVLQDMRVPWFIDDRADTCAHLAKAGLNPIIFRQPWNEQLGHTYPVVTSWLEIEALAYGHLMANSGA